MAPDLPEPPAEDERLTTSLCPNCNRQGQLYVTPIHWGSTRICRWHCRNCQHIRVTPDRRAEDR